jgi:hypothetical protein
LAIVAPPIPSGYGFGVAQADDAGRVPPAYQPEPDAADRARRMRDDFALPQQQRFHAALLAAREVAERTDLTATEQQRLQMLADYRCVQAEADWLRARLLGWHPELLVDDPLTQLHGVALDLDCFADRMEAAEYSGLAGDLRLLASQVRDAAGGATGPLPAAGAS